jgi:hypothetical protein
MGLFQAGKCKNVVVFLFLMFVLGLQPLAVIARLNCCVPFLFTVEVLQWNLRWLQSF